MTEFYFQGTPIQPGQQARMLALDGRDFLADVAIFDSDPDVWTATSLDDRDRRATGRTPTAAVEALLRLD